MNPWLLMMLASAGKGLLGNSANNQATGIQMNALKNGMGAIQNAGNQGLMAQYPFMQHAGEDFNQQRGMVNSGYYDTPYGKSFTPQQFKPGGFSFQPGQQGASFAPQSFSRDSFTPQALPQKPVFPYNPGTPPMPLGQPGGGDWSTSGGGGNNSIISGSMQDKIGQLLKALGVSTRDSIEGPVHSVMNLGRNIADTASDAIRDPAHIVAQGARDGVHTVADLGRNTTHGLMGVARHPLDVIQHTRDAINASLGLGKDIGSTASNAVDGTLDMVSDITRDPLHATAQFGRDVGGTIGQTGRNAKKVYKSIKGLFG